MVEHIEENSSYQQWHHAPSHLFMPGTAYIITAKTYQKDLYFNTPERRYQLQNTIFEQAQTHGWDLQAWAVMSNYYHLIANSSQNIASLKNMVTAIHSLTAIRINKEDQTPGRKVWFQYRDTCLTYERSYLARLHYVHQNPVKHGLVQNALEYPWCSMGWFIRHAEPGYQRTVFSFKWDRISVDDDF